MGWGKGKGRGRKGEGGRRRRRGVRNGIREGKGKEED